MGINRYLSLFCGYTPTEVKPMTAEGIPTPCRYKLGTKPTTYRPCPNNPPRMGSKRRRQWR